MKPVQNANEWENFCHNMVLLRQTHGYSLLRMAFVLRISPVKLRAVERGEWMPKWDTNPVSHPKEVRRTSVGAFCRPLGPLRPRNEPSKNRIGRNRSAEKEVTFGWLTKIRPLGKRCAATSAGCANRTAFPSRRRRVCCALPRVPCGSSKAAGIPRE